MIADFQLDELQPGDSREAAAEDRKWHLHTAKVLPAVNAAVLAGFLLCYFSNGFSLTGILDSVYELQAHSLACGHLYISPGPGEMYFQDISMYRGNYYFYQGLLPSIALASLAHIVGRTAAHYLITYGFLFLLGLYLQKILIELFESSDECRPRPNLSAHKCALPAAWLLILVLPFPPDMDNLARTWFFGRFIIYEQQIFFGLGLGLPGVYHLIRGARDSKPRDLMVASFLLFLAAWTRATWFPLATLVLLGAVLLCWKWMPSGKRISSLGTGLWFGLGSFALLAVLMLANYVRFGSCVDFGVIHQNLGNYMYQRDFMQYFSATTRFWNFWYTMAAYYISPRVLDQLGLTRLASSLIEFRAPSMFWNNPQLAPMLIIVPWAVVRSHERTPPLFAGLVVLLGVAVYFNVLIGAASTMVILRYLYGVLLLHHDVVYCGFVGLSQTIVSNWDIACCAGFVYPRHSGALRQDTTRNNDHAREQGCGPDRSSRSDMAGTPPQVVQRIVRSCGLRHYDALQLYWHRGKDRRRHARKRLLCRIPRSRR